MNGPYCTYSHTLECGAPPKELPIWYLNRLIEAGIVDEETVNGIH
jgi:hypothetical protein